MIAVIYSNKMPPRHNRQGSQTELWTTVSMIRKNRLSEQTARRVWSLISWNKSFFTITLWIQTAGCTEDTMLITVKSFNCFYRVHVENFLFFNFEKWLLMCRKISFLVTNVRKKICFLAWTWRQSIFNSWILKNLKEQRWSFCNALLSPA